MDDTFQFRSNVLILSDRHPFAFAGHKKYAGGQCCISSMRNAFFCLRIKWPCLSNLILSAPDGIDKRAPTQRSLMRVYEDENASRFCHTVCLLKRKEKRVFIKFLSSCFAALPVCCGHALLFF